jgi:hypothetical protein
MVMVNLLSKINFKFKGNGKMVLWFNIIINELLYDIEKSIFIFLYKK